MFVPEIPLGFGALAPADADRLTRYLAALVNTRGVVHTAVAFNAVYFGYDLAFGGYVGGPVEFDTFPQVKYGQTSDALPIGAMVNVATGADSLYAEVVYKEGAHPLLNADGDVPAWLSGAPAGAYGPGQRPDTPEHTVLDERLVLDFNAFGPNLVATDIQLERLRRRSRWVDPLGHLLLASRYPSAADAEMSDLEFYARYLLTRGRDQLLAGPLPLVLTTDAGEWQLAAALRSALTTISDALAAIPALRLWRDYAFPRATLASRLADSGPLGGSDLASLATSTGRAGLAAGRRFAASGPAVRYTAVGQLLRTVAGANRQLVGLGYAAAVCHTNAVIGDYARRDADEHGVLPSGAHLRLDDPWQGGGVWQASNPPGPHTAADPLVPYGLGWLDSQASQIPAGEAGTEDELDARAELLSVTDSHLSWNVTLRLVHTLAGSAMVPDRILDEVESSGLVGSGLRLVLSHDGYDLDPGEVTQSVTFAQNGTHVRLTGVVWPLEFFPGIVLTFTWQRGAVLLRVRSTLLDMSVTIDGEEYEHRYDPAVLTRDAIPGYERRGRNVRGPLTLRERILRAIRQVGKLDQHGVAVLPKDRLADLVYGPQAGEAGTTALDPIITEMLADATLSVDHATRIGTKFQWPTDGTGEIVTVLVWRPRPVTGDSWQGRADAVSSPDTQDSNDLGKFVHANHVAPFLRRLQPGQHASEGQKAEYRQLLARFGRTGELPAGHTLVREHTRYRRSLIASVETSTRHTNLAAEPVSEQQGDNP